MKWDSILQDAEQVWELDRAPGLEPDELEELLKDAEVPMEITTARKRQAAPPKKKRKVSKEEFEPITHVFDLVEPDFAPSKKISSRSQGHTDDSYGDADTLQHADAADKTARRKTLRFHTSKIESASARRQGARNQAVGGDDDLPYRERKKEKEARLAKEAKNKVQHQGGADLDDEEPQSHEKRRREEDDEGDAVDSPDEYYELVKNNSKEKKEQKKAEYKALQAAAKSVGLIVLRIAHSYALPFQTRLIYGRCFWSSLTHQGYYGEQGTHTAPAEECAESQSQETTKVREGEEENFVSESCLQQWYFRQWTIRWRKDWYIQSRQKYSFGMTKDVYISPSVKSCKFHFGLAKTFKIIRVRQPKCSKCTKATDFKITTSPFASPFWRVEYFFPSPL
jgi:hypothetical protein